ncbi:MAG: hypothetical protein Q7T71_18735, partial [Herbiconiux sp.]|nr:hypothetical protein [Herbiconiux sp.]
MTRALPRIGLVAAILVIVALLVALVVGVGSILSQGGVAAGNPFAGRTLFVDPGSKAATAAASETEAGDTETAAVFSAIAAVPTAIWLTPEKHPTGEVGD